MYRLGEELGRGALGRVVAVTGDDGERLAGKVLHASQQQDPRALARFEAEARLAAGIAHPNLVAVRGLVEIDGERVLLMERVDGRDLATALAVEGKLPPERVAALGAGIAAGLGAAHRAGLVHRDLKPANVLVAADGTPKIADFGLARATTFAGVDRDALAVVGTPDYMAPEAIDPLAVDTRSDLYALGCILCEAATGRPPYQGATAFAVLEAHRTAPVPALSEVPAELRRVIRWLLARSPADRPQSASQVERALAALGSTALVAAPARELEPAAARAVRACPRCGASGPAEVAVCFGCGEPQVVLGAGDHTVFVVGPGPLASKLDTGHRQRLLDWLRANPTLGLDAAALAKEAPRLPFPLVVGVDGAAAAALARALGGLGLEAQAVQGGRYALPAVRKKAWTLSGRVGFIVSMSSIGVWNHAGFAVLPILAAMGAGSLLAGFRLAGRPAAVRTAATAALPPAVAAPLGRVAGVVPALEAARHRDALRGVVERALALREAVPADERARIEPDLGRIVDLATVAASRLDELDRRLAAADLRDVGDAARAAWVERDRWAARLLEVTAFLDALRARWAAARAAGDGGLLDELRAQVEALEEVEAL